MDRAHILVKNVSKYFVEKKGWLRKEGEKIVAVENVSMEIISKKIISFIGESGSGKTTLGRMISGLLSPSSGTIERSASPQMIFQNPALSFNPRFRMGDALMEPLIYRGWKKEKAVDLVRENLYAVGLVDEHLNRYPHQFSLGQKQRLAIARALIVAPDILIADEIVSSLDLSLQYQILELLMKLVEERSIGIVFISHDLACVRALAEWVYVFYKGNIVEEGPTSRVLVNPNHEYTKWLVANEQFCRTPS